MLRDSAPPLPKMLWPWSRGLGFVAATCHMHAASAYSPFTLGRSPAPLVGQALLLAWGVPLSLGIHFGSRAQVTYQETLPLHTRSRLYYRYSRYCLCWLTTISILLTLQLTSHVVNEAVIALVITAGASKRPKPPARG